MIKIRGDAPRYALEDYMDFCYWEKTYKKNYLKRDHIANHRVRADYIIKLLTKLFNNVDNYVLRPTRDDHDHDDDEGFNLDFEEMKAEMKTDRTYKQKWFKAAYEANEYIDKLLYNMRPKVNSRKMPKSRKVSRRKKIKSKRSSKKRSY